ncbi:MAG: hypothetical protein Q8R92_11475 [Deltaproteobacteria bacterium]|nr:hypothetical protein [Deltaproteobacteria bacterium]
MNAREMAGESKSMSFVARIWLERGHNGEPVWRGHIKHVQGGEESYFQDLGEMNEFLERVSGIPGPSAASESGAHASPPSGSVARRKRKV